VSPKRRLWRRIARALDPRRVRDSADPDHAADQEVERLRGLPRYAATTTDLLGPPIHLVDAASFLAQHQAIIRSEQYRFEAGRPDPLILDCGANIGVASIFWKRLYPLARIIAFEPDPTVFHVLSRNLDTLGLMDVERVQRAVWTDATSVPFWTEGADAGRLVEVGGQVSGPRQTVQTVRLRDYLDTSVAMLKVDIEGAEVDVLLDCADRLTNVQNLVVEYHSFLLRRQRLDELLRVVLAAGFRLHIVSEVAAAQPFLKRLDNYGMDLQLNIFAYRA
jgi:FkbM family methyltransferase